MTRPTPRIKRIAINTGGGDAPGLNAVIRAVTLAAINRGWEVIGIRDGYGSFLGGEPIVKLTRSMVHGISALGGTILGTTNKGNPFEIAIKLDGMKRARPGAELVVEGLRKAKVDGLIAVGGDGSLAIGYKLMNMGVPVIGVPKTIDNDLMHTNVTFGFDTAVQTATEAIDKLHSTADAHDRVMVVEVMGRYAGWIALHAGVSGSCHVVLIPEMPFDIAKVCGHLAARRARGRNYAIVCVAEGAYARASGPMFKTPTQKGRERRLGGIGEWVAHEIQKRIGWETRSIVLGHLQRGGSPSTSDRLLGLRYGAAAIRLAAAGLWGHMVTFNPPNMGHVPLEEIAQRTKRVSIEGDTVLTAREMGICFGD
ncbi:MAG: ATP-dependent 6-phosphofructokinase [Vicinamibacteria bacterium]|nr:ATP-dependent 6-phosphofructokinase [Vicinamibacteria bacterium]